MTSSRAVSISANSVEKSGSSGVDVNSSAECSVHGNVSNHNRHSEVLLLDATDCLCTSNICADNGQDLTSAWQRSGITVWESVRRCRDIVVACNRCHDTQATKTQSYGVSVINRPQNIVLNGNLVDGNATSGLRFNSNSDTTFVAPVRRVEVKVDDAGLAIPHGLSYVPRSMTITMTSQGSVWQSAAPDETYVYLRADALGRSAQVALG